MTNFRETGLALAFLCGTALSVTAQTGGQGQGTPPGAGQPRQGETKELPVAPAQPPRAAAPRTGETKEQPAVPGQPPRAAAPRTGETKEQPVVPGQPPRAAAPRTGETKEQPAVPGQPPRAAAPRTGETKEQPAVPGQSPRAGEAPRPAITVQIQPEQRRQVREVITRTNVRETTNINFNIGLGISVPRTVTLSPIPLSVVEIVPQYEGYLFFLVRGEIIIVDPRTQEIVAVLPA